MSRISSRLLRTILLSGSGLLMSLQAAPAPSAPAALSVDQSVTLLPDGRFLLLGGRGKDSKPIGDAFLVGDDGKEDHLTTGLSFPRFGHSATVLPNGTVAVIGGVGTDNSMVEQVEIFDPVNRSFKVLEESLITPRSHHTATVLPNGTLLIVGGLTGDNVFSDDIQIWNYVTGKVTGFSSVLRFPRENHRARLLADGKVWITGGTDYYGRAQTHDELLDPESLTSVELQTNLSPENTANSPQISLSSPNSGESNVPINAPLWLLFSKDVNVRTLSSAQVVLKTAAGKEVKAHVVGAESGKLAFILPKAPLLPATDYILVLDGVADPEGAQLPKTTIHFQTAGIPDDATMPEWIPTAQNLAGDWNSGTGTSKWQDMPALRAEQGMTALSGQVLTLSGYPLAKVTLSYEGFTAQSDGTGRFLLKSLSEGTHVFTIDGRSANQTGAQYGLYEVKVNVKAGITNVLNYTIWMSKLDMAHAVAIKFPTTKETVITTPRIPGLELHLPANTTIVDHEGKPAKNISITAIPLDKPPFPLPAGVKIPTYFTIQPGGASIEVKKSSSAATGAWLVYPNAYDLPAATVFDFWNYDADARGWYVYGQGKVNQTRTQVLPGPGVYIYELTGAMVGVPGVAPSTGPSAGSGPAGTDGEPVDLSSGLFVYSHTDLTIPDSIPLSVNRTYRPNDSMSRPFGVGQTDNYDIFMVGDTFPYTYQELILPDGSRIRFNRISTGTSYTDAIYQHTATRGPWYGATLCYNPAAFVGAYWVLKTRDGMIYNFPEADGLSTQGLQAVNSIRDRNGNILSIVRDSNGNLSKVTSQNGNSLSYTIDTLNRITAITDNTGRKLSYAYNTQGDLSTFTDPTGGVTTYTYDTDNNMLTIKDPVGNTYLTNQYDANGRVIKQTMSDGGVYQFAWTLSANTAQTWVMQSSSTVAGQVNRYSTTDYEGYTGLIASVQVTDPRGYVRKVVFNNLGYIASDTHALGQPVQQVFTSAYYADNLLESTTDPLGRVTSYDYDNNGNTTTFTKLAGTTGAVKSTATYTPAFSQVSTFTDPLGHTATYAYDGLGNLTASKDPLGNQTSIAYDNLGDPISITDPAKEVVQLSYLGGYLASVKDPLGNLTSDFADYAGRITSTTDPQGHVTQIQYDQLDRVTQITDPLGNVTKYSYNGNGDLLQVEDPLTHTLGASYDSLDRQVSFTDGLARKAKSTYDHSGNLVSITDRIGQVTALSYDALNRISTVGFGAQTTGGKTTYQSTIQYTYDAVGRLTQAVDSLGGTVTRAYDSLDRVTKETTAQGSISYNYDADNRLTSSQVTGQSAISYSYDSDSRLIGIVQGTKTVKLTLDSDGRRTSMTLPNGIIATYTYDGGSRLTGIAYALGTTSIGNLVYTYDSLNHRTTAGGTLAYLSLPTALSSATYDAANELTKWGTAAVTHDADGETLSDSSNTFTWNARGHLATISGLETDSFVYDAFGRRVSKVKDGTQTQYLYSGVNPVQKLIGASTTANMISGGVDEFFDYAEGTTDMTPLFDGLGSVVALADAAGGIATEYEFSPYGSTTPLGAISDNAQEYTGRENDGSLYYYRARYYNANVGRFLNEDPLGLAAGSVNFYAYTGDDSVDFNDPFGMDKSAPSNPACSAPKYAQARSFISANLGYAQQIASQLNTSPGNILGLSGNESGWGTGFLITAGTNNYFSLTAGKAFGGTIGTYQHGSYTYGVYPSPGFLSSGQSFANSYFGTRVNGISDPLAFSQALNANGSFNSEHLATPYDRAIANTINLANTLIGCHN